MRRKHIRSPTSTPTYPYDVRELVRGELLVMSTADRSFLMESAFRWVDAGDGRTRMTPRSRGKSPHPDPGIRVLSEGGRTLLA